MHSTKRVIVLTSFIDYKSDSFYSQPICLYYFNTNRLSLKSPFCNILRMLLLILCVYQYKLHSDAFKKGKN